MTPSRPRRCPMRRRRWRTSPARCSPRRSPSKSTRRRPPRARPRSRRCATIPSCRPSRSTSAVKSWNRGKRNESEEDVAASATDAGADAAPHGRAARGRERWRRHGQGHHGRRQEPPRHRHRKGRRRSQRCRDAAGPRRRRGQRGLAQGRRSHAGSARGDDRRDEDSGTVLMTAPPLANLINELTKLPGIGGKSASRLAYHILKRPVAEAEQLASAILEVKSKIFRCSTCNNMTDVDPCAICSDPRRDPSLICVVEEAFNIPTIEQTRDFKGVFHVLLGALSPLKGVGPQDIDVAGLLKRVQGGDVREVIIATNPNVEGEATALYIAQQLRPLGVRTTRLAFGLPVGGDLEYADQVTMAKA